MVAEAQSRREKQDLGCPGYDSKLHLMVRHDLCTLGNVEYSFITITLKSTLTKAASTCLDPIFGSNRIVQSFHWPTGVECSPMILETWVQSLVATYQRFLKWYLIPPCLTLSIIRYASRVKWSNPGKGVVLSPTHRCSS